MRKVNQTYQKKLNAFSLFESIIAVSIISILTGIGSLVLANVSKSEKGILYYEAKQDVDFYLHELKENSTLISNQFDKETYSISQHVDFYKGNKSLYEVTYIVQSGEEIWFTEKHLIINPHAK